MCFFGRESYGLRVFGIKTVEVGEILDSLISGIWVLKFM